MSEQTRQTLAEAFDLIEAGQLEAAQALIKPLLETQRDNPDVWWLYAHAVPDSDTARAAIKTVLSLDPNYPEAIELLNEVEQQARVQRAALVPEKEIRFSADLPPTLPDLPDLDNDDFNDVDFGLEDEEDDDTEEEATPRSRLILLAALLIIVVVAIVTVALLTSRPAGGDKPTPTAVVAVVATSTPFSSIEVTAEATLTATIAVTEEATLELTAVPTQSPVDQTPEVTETTTDVAPELTFEPLALPSAEATEKTPTLEPSPTEAFSPEIYQIALAGFTLTEAGVNFEPTLLGNTLVANVCTTAGPELRSALPNVMDIMARQPTSIEIEAMGTRLINCDDKTTLLFIAVPTSTAQTYASGSLSEADFQAAWKSF